MNDLFVLQAAALSWFFFFVPEPDYWGEAFKGTRCTLIADIPGI